MPYTAEISRNNPSCILFLVDQSASMGDQYQSIGKPKSQALADVINRILQQLVIKCAKSEGIRDYYHVGVLGYGDKGVKPAFGGNLSGKLLVPISGIADNPARIENRTKKVPDGAGGLVDLNVKFPIWFDGVASGGTPMTAAFKEANSVIQNWLAANPYSFPPVVINITDGESTDGDPISEMNRLTEQSSVDGNVLLFNLHTNARSVNPLSFPGVGTTLPDSYAEMLFRGASLLPTFMRQVAAQEFGLTIQEGAKAFVLNGDIDLIISAIDIGTRPSLQLR